MDGRIAGMTEKIPTILATSGGWQYGARHNLEFGPLVHYAVELSGAHGRRPKVCHLGTAGGDQLWFNAKVAEAGVTAGFEVTSLNLFSMPTFADPLSHLLEQDVVWVNGGSVANLLAVWHVHGLDEIFRQVWEAGVVLGGVSAGSICWHTGGTTDSFGPDLRAVTNGLGLVPYSNGVHYDSEEQRRPAYHQFISDGTLPAGYATDDGVGLLYRGTEMVEAVTETDDKYAYFVERSAGGGAIEETITPRRLKNLR
jgi:peptidase E